MKNRPSGRPTGPSCEFHTHPNDPGTRCRKSARVRIKQNVRGNVHEAYRCWRHYVRMENALRNATEGDGNIIVVEEV